MSNPAPGTARINDGPWVPCRFTLDGTSRYVDWAVDVAPGEDLPALGAAQIEIAICAGVTVFGDVLVSDVHVNSLSDNSATAMGNGALRGSRG